MESNLLKRERKKKKENELCTEKIKCLNILKKRIIGTTINL